MVPDTFSGFFAASAGVAGALIGLLFVAISVNPKWSDDQSRIDLDVRAGVAFSALADALVVALFALIPGVNLGLTAAVVGVVALTSCVALGIVLLRAPTVPRRTRKVRLLAGQAVAYALQVWVGIELARHPHEQGPLKTLAVLTVVFFLVGIARAWELIGARDGSLMQMVGEVVRARGQLPVGPLAPGATPPPPAPPGPPGAQHQGSADRADQ